ncbi:hypothetical protein ScPMuIL_001439 [Solemya velum]
MSRISKANTNQIALCYLASLLVCLAGKSLFQKDSLHNRADKCPIDPINVINQTRGRISSYNYPENYPNNCIQKWSIQQAFGSVVTISFGDIDLEIGDDLLCNRDYLEVQSGNESVYFCKDTGPRVYISRINYGNVWLTFHTNDAITKRGFSLLFISGPIQSASCKADEFHCDNHKCIYNVWQCNEKDECGDGSDEKNCKGVVSCGKENIQCISSATKKEICLPDIFHCDDKQDCLNNEDEDEAVCAEMKCKFSLTNLTGIITSPNYPNVYPNNMDCSWSIHIPNTRAIIQLRFVDFDLQVKANTDYVIVYDGSDVLQQVLGKFHHNNLPPAIIESSSNRLLVVFHSDSTESERGFNATYQQKGYCLADQGRCGPSELECYSSSKRCDGTWDCSISGADEKGCAKCEDDLYWCGSQSTQCYHFHDHCNGVGYCSNNADELGCSPIQCGSHNGTFLCDNGRCIYETWLCDRANDCEDYSDEKNCSGSTNLVIIAAVAGSLICALLLVVALGCTCKLYVLRLQDQIGESPMSRLQAHFMRRRAPPPYHEAMLTSRPYDEVRRDMLRGRRSRRSRRQNSHNLASSPSVNNNLNARNVSDLPQSENPPAVRGNDGYAGLDSTISPDLSNQISLPLPNNFPPISNDRDCDMEGNDDDEEEEEEEEQEEDSNNTNPTENTEVQVDISQAAGISAHWRQPVYQNNNSENRAHKNDSKPGDMCIENVSASGDSLDITVPGDDVIKDEETDLKAETIPSILGSQDSLNSLIPPGDRIQKSDSQDSLNSEGSDMSTGSQTHLLNS